MTAAMVQWAPRRPRNGPQGPTFPPGFTPGGRKRIRRRFTTDLPDDMLSRPRATKAAYA
jgi:hypothetical protein